MNDQTRKNLNELLERFMDGPAAEAAAKEIDAGDRLLEASPAPVPDREMIAFIKVWMVAASLRRRWRIRVVRGSLAAAAALVMALLIGLPDSSGPSHPPSGPPRVRVATIMPAAHWESDDLAKDDLRLVYFSAEVRRIEAQIQALEAEENDSGGTASPDDLERELLAIETEFWKGQ
jgi:hypothetical protein